MSVVTQDINLTDNILDQYENKWGLKQEFNDDIRCRAFEILNTDFSGTKYTSEEWIDKSICLSQFAFQLQRLINKEESRIHYLNTRIDHIILPQINEQNAYYFQDKRNLAISNDAVARNLSVERHKIELKVKRLQFLSSKIEHIADKFTEYSRATRKTEKKLDGYSN